jgi:hypothetical protein
MARWVRLRVRGGRTLFSYGHERPEDRMQLKAGDEFVVSFGDAATLLRKNDGTRAFEIVADFEADTPPEGTISIGRP